MMLGQVESSGCIACCDGFRQATLTGVVSTLPLGRAVSRSTPVFHPNAGHDGQIARLLSSSATTVKTNVA